MLCFYALGGLIRPGYHADLVVFDYDRLEDRATILEPSRYPEGIVHVIVHGQITVDEGELTGALPGQVLDRHEVRPAGRTTSPDSSG